MAANGEGWRFAREVRLGELVAVLGALSAIAATYIELKLDPVRQEIAAVRDAGRTQAEAAQQFKTELRADLQRVEAKLDRLIEAIPQRIPSR